jgi:hypothetical protein
MFERVKEWFAGKPQIEYRIIEIPQGRTHRGWDEETKRSVTTLLSHPGFVALTDRINFQKALLEQQLKAKFHKDLREADYLQAGILWLGYLEYLVKQSLDSPQPKYRTPDDEELEEFEKINAQITRLT